MNIRSMRLSAAALATIALAACTKPADKPAVTDSTAPANATPTVVDSSVKADSVAPKPVTDSARPAVDSARK